MNKVMQWVKANVFSVIFLALVVIVPVAMFFVTNWMNGRVRADVDKRYRMLAPLEQLEKTQVSRPGDSTDPGSAVLVNAALLQEYEAASGHLKKDADAVLKLAEERNQRGRGVIMEGVLPEMPVEEQQTAPENFHRELVRKYEELLRRVRAGDPPSLESMRETLTKEKDLYTSQTLKKAPTEKLTAEEEEMLKEALQTVRLKRYMEAATASGVYLVLEALHMPEWVQSAQPTPTELYTWQWQYWATEDVLAAIAKVNDVNTPEMNLVQAPVKRILDLTVLGLPSEGAAASSGTTGASSAGGGRMQSAGGGGGGAAFKRGGGAPTPSAPAAPAAGAAAGGADYKVSFTGRTSNTLYDVVRVKLRLVADTARLPAVLDSLAQQNFITVIDLEMTPRDAYADAAEGFLYGANPVSDVTLTLETVWFRNWTKSYMPNDLQVALGIVKPAEPAPAAGGAGGGGGRRQ